MEQADQPIDRRELTMVRQEISLLFEIVMGQMTDAQLSAATALFDRDRALLREVGGNFEDILTVDQLHNDLGNHQREHQREAMRQYELHQKDLRTLSRTSQNMKDYAAYRAWDREQERL